MTFKDKTLYHQIHPVKLTTDWVIGGLLANILIWYHYLLFGLLVTFIPAIVISVIIIQSVDVEKYRQSTFGHYLKSYMTPFAQIFRLFGAVLVSIAAWYHSGLGIILGLGIIILAWSYGLLK